MIGLWLACTASAPPETLLQPAPTADTGPVAEPVCPSFGEPEVMGVVGDPTLTEASGLVRAGDWLFTHNDSGEAVVFGLNDRAQVELRVPVRLPIFDLEDIAAREGELWLADVGDNLSVRQTLSLLVVDVPDEGTADLVPRVVTTAWPDGPQDAETLLVDPVGGDVLLVSKEWDGDITQVGRLIDPAADASDLEVVAEVLFGGLGIGQTALVTGGDIAPDGSGVVLRTYLSAWWFPRRPGEDWAQTFARVPCEVPVLGESQGEALAVDASGIWTISEGDAPKLNRTPWSRDGDGQ